MVEGNTQCLQEPVLQSKIQTSQSVSGCLQASDLISWSYQIYVYSVHAFGACKVSGSDAIAATSASATNAGT